MSVLVEVCAGHNSSGQGGYVCHEECFFDQIESEVKEKDIYVYSSRNRNCPHYVKMFYNFGQVTTKTFKQINSQFNVPCLPVFQD